MALAHVFTLGSFAIPGTLVTLLLGSGTALAIACWLRHRGEAATDRYLWVSFATALLMARVIFVSKWCDVYSADPIMILQFRDEGFALLPGLAIFTCHIAWLSIRHRALRRPLLLSALAGLSTFAATSWTMQCAYAAPSQPIENVVLRDVFGHVTPLRGVRHRPLIIELWNERCRSCKQQLTALIYAQRNHPEIRFVFAKQGESYSEEYAALLKEGFARHILVDQDLTLSNGYGVTHYPATLFISDHGELRDLQKGDLSPAVITEEIYALDRTREIATR